METSVSGDGDFVVQIAVLNQTEQRDAARVAVGIGFSCLGMIRV
jgi:hypothetical protein